MQSEQEKEGGSGSEESTRSARDSGLIPGSGRSLRKEIATHSSILDWRIPQTEEPGGLQSMGSHRLGAQLNDKHTRTRKQKNTSDLEDSIREITQSEQEKEKRTI